MVFVGTQKPNTQDTQLKIGTVPAKPGHLVTLSQVIKKRGKPLCAFDNNARAALTLNFDVNQPAGHNWPPVREFETPDVEDR